MDPLSKNKVSLSKVQLEQILEEWTDDEIDLLENEAYDSLDSELEFVMEASDEEDEISEDENEQFENAENNQKCNGKDGTEWMAKPYGTSRAKSCNIIKGKVDTVVLPPGKSLDSIWSSFKMFIDNTVCEEILKYTNKEAVTTYGQSRKWNPIDMDELHAFFGLLITAGHMKSNAQNYRIFWDKLYGITIFKATMGVRRFMEILRFIRFDDKDTRSNRRKTDKLAPIRSIWEMVNHNFGKYYMPGENIVVDEQLMPCRSRCSFIQYMPSKPDKYGIKIWWLCDSKTAYPLGGIPYTGKVGNTRAVGLGREVVENLCAPYFWTNRNVTMDNYFTSKELAESLLTNGLTLVGTLRKNKACIPPEFQPNKNRETRTTLFGFQKNITIASHVPKPGKAVIFLSTMHHDDKMTEKNGKVMSEINKYYDLTKGGVDTFDQLIHEYMIKRKTNRWPFAFFMNMLDAAGIAAYVIWNNKFPFWNQRKPNKRNLFLRELGESLVEPYIRKRQNNKNLHQSSQTAIKSYLGALTTETSSTRPSTSSSNENVRKRKRCHLCPYAKSKMQKQCCDNCQKNVCNEHSTTTINCSSCQNN